MVALGGRQRCLKATVKEAKPVAGKSVDPQKHFTSYFRLPAGLARCSTISPGAKIAYARLLRFSGGTCYISVKALAADIGCHSRQAQRYLSELEAQGLIRRLEQSGKTNIIEFLWNELLRDPERWPNVTPAKTSTNDKSVMGTPDRNDTRTCDTSDVEPLTDVSHEVIEGVYGKRISGDRGGESSSASSSSLACARTSGLPADELQKPQSAARRDVAVDRKPKIKIKDAAAEAESAAKSADFVCPPPRPPPPVNEVQPQKHWTSEDCAQVRAVLNDYMSEEPPTGFVRSCELRVVGATAQQVCDLLMRKYSSPRYRRGAKYGPREWNWFLEVVGNEFHGQHLPEPKAKIKSELPKEQFDELTAALE